FLSFCVCVCVCVCVRLYKRRCLCSRHLTRGTGLPVTSRNFPRYKSDWLRSC
ncbi:hypothetical protein IscW_ISCW010972, partial [Ixodes scapularis]